MTMYYHLDNINLNSHKLSILGIPWLWLIKRIYLNVLLTITRFYLRLKLIKDNGDYSYHLLIIGMFVTVNKLMKIHLFIKWFAAVTNNIVWFKNRNMWLWYILIKIYMTMDHHVDNINLDSHKLLFVYNFD